MLSILAAFGAAFGILYMGLTIKLGSSRRKRRSDLTSGGFCEASGGTIQGFYGCHLTNFISGDTTRDGEDGNFWFHAADLMWHGELIWLHVINCGNEQYMG